MTLQIGDRVRCINGTDFHGLEGRVVAVREQIRVNSYRYKIEWDTLPSRWYDHGGLWSFCNVELIDYTSVIEDWRL